MSADGASEHRSIAPEVLVLLSGGIDSSACVDFYRSLGRAVCALHISYGQGAAVQERQAAARVATHFGVPISFRRLESARPKSIGEVRGRNGFLVLTAVVERPPSVTAIALGIHAGTQYLDCSSAFVGAINETLRLDGKGLELLAPFLTWTKGDVLHYCAERSVPIQLTYSCERGGDTPCGVCLSCTDRRAAHACP